MGEDEHEVVECVLNVLQIFPAWNAFATISGGRDTYLLVNYVIRYTVKFEVKVSDTRRYFFLQTYREAYPNSLQKIIFKVMLV